MSEQIREQVSAFLDGELPNTETELLLKRLTRDGELRESFGRYAVIGEALRSTWRLTANRHRCRGTHIKLMPHAGGGLSPGLRLPRAWRRLPSLLCNNVRFLRVHERLLR